MTTSGLSVFVNNQAKPSLRPSRKQKKQKRNIKKNKEHCQKLFTNANNPGRHIEDMINYNSTFKRNWNQFAVEFLIIFLANIAVQTLLNLFRTPMFA
jgi:hypothetical protein